MPVKEISSVPVTGIHGRTIPGVHLGEADSGKTVRIKQGQNIIVILPSNPTTGYKWRVSSTDRSFGYPVSDDYFARGNPRSRPIGQGGVQQLIWHSNAAVPLEGTHRVTLSYSRARGTPAKTFTFAVQIAAAAQPAIEPKPSTFEPYFVDLRAALNDGKVTKQEVDKLVAPHYRAAWKDRDYYAALQDLASANPQTKWTDFQNGNAKEKPVKVSAEARKLLQTILTWE